MNTPAMNLNPSIIGIHREDGDIDIICAFPYGISIYIRESITRLLLETTNLDVRQISLDLDIPEVWNFEEEGE